MVTFEELKAKIEKEYENLEMGSPYNHLLAKLLTLEQCEEIVKNAIDKRIKELAKMTDLFNECRKFELQDLKQELFGDVK